MWYQREYVDIFPPHSLQVILVLSLSQKVVPFPVALCLWSSAPCWTQINIDVHNIDLVFIRFVCSLTLSDILTMAVSDLFTQIGLHPAIRPSYA